MNLVMKKFNARSNPVVRCAQTESTKDGIWFEVVLRSGKVTKMFIPNTNYVRRHGGEYNVKLINK